jgi:hypothetical protein
VLGLFTRRLVAVAAAGGIAVAYLQVTSAPTAAPAPTPSVETIVGNVKADLQWLRDDFPRDPEWWKAAYTQSSGNLLQLESMLSGDSADRTSR